MSGRGLVLPLLLGIGLIAAPPPRVSDQEPFLTSDRCIACHKGVSTADGADVSIGFDWRASMMANGGRDPYWQAAVRREIIDHPHAAEAIEDKCSRCHMPMANELARSEGGHGSVFANLPGGEREEELGVLAADGVSCAVCHQILAGGLGSEGSFIGGFRIAAGEAGGSDATHGADGQGIGPPADATGAGDARAVFGPFEPDPGGAGIMHSATGYRPTAGPHTQSSELCATCHTLFTHSVRVGGEGPEFPEQVPYLEWRASDYARAGESCQDCHMPEVDEDVAVTGVLGRERPDVSRHVFRGGNFFMLRVLNRYRDELGVVALPQELELAATRTAEHLRTSTATIAIGDAVAADGELRFSVELDNRAGHKFPTAYPSRRAWLHVTVRDARGEIVFESGAFRPDGRIEGNDNDDDPGRYERHHAEITAPEQVQIYEAVMVDRGGAVTTGLMKAERWVKDNRLLPHGFDPRGQEARIGVFGGADDDDDFGPGGDRVRYRIAVEDDAAAPYSVTAELWFQPIAYRWAHNLGDYESFETERFVRYYEAMARSSALELVSASAEIR